ncbi:MAG: glycoside hydrolase family 127 protein [Bacteroidales bacterium]|nr:glycoside hydrolase family 127 protein [Bacteroidales bacterium]
MKGIKFYSVLLALFGLMYTEPMQAQSALYPSHFDLHEVTLLDGPFKTAQDLNYKTLLEFDVDRMLTPYIRQSGLSATSDAQSRYYQWEAVHPAFESFAWNPAMAMDGHILGHYLSAISISYQSCHDEALRSAFKTRIDYIISVLNDCQSVFDSNKDGLKGYLGGIPDNIVWIAMADADYRVYNQRGSWVPFYCEHKVLAGLRDAYIYGGNETAKGMFKKLCDWAIMIVGLFSDDVMEMQILQWETGGMNEVLADAYKIFGESKYLKAAQKYSHQIVIENMNQDPQNEFLDKKHTNSMTASFVGFSRINQVKSDKRYRMSAQNYWEDVVARRVTAIGGVGQAHYFLPASKCSSIVNNGDGPDLCTTYNMLKLTELLFDGTRDARYSDYYERALLNHVLASIDPETGGFTFFTSLRPESYRIYSTVNESMWCCVGTGMESNAKYGDFIYTLSEDTLFVNLFIPSELNSARAALKLESGFPYGNTSKITVQKSGTYTLAVRHPSWAAQGFKVTLNGQELSFKPDLVTPGKPSYLACGKIWKQGDVLEITYPMQLTFVACPNYRDYIALRYGPSVLAAQTSSNTEGDENYEVLVREYGGKGMSDHSPQAREKFRSTAFAPMLICELPEVPNRVKMVDPAKLEFQVDATAPGSQWKEVKMKPFFDLHHTRYSIYWNRQNEASWLKNPLFKDQLRKTELEALTYDQVTPGNSESEQAHFIRLSETGSRGNLNGRTFRDAQPNEWFEYRMNVEKAQLEAPGQDLALSLNLSISDRGRSCSIWVDGKELSTYLVPTSNPDGGKEKFFEKVFTIPASLVAGKKALNVRISSVNGSYAPRVYQIRIMKYDERLMQ